MTRFFLFGAALCALAASSLVSARAASRAGDELASRQFLVGNWNCTYTAGASEGSYLTEWSNTLDGRWLQQTYDQAASAHQQAFKATYFVGFDETHDAWIRFGAMSTGQYFAIRMSDAGEGSWTWKYASFFPRRTPETASSDATFTKRSATEYAIDGPTYPSASGVVTEHHDCKKS